MHLFESCIFLADSGSGGDAITHMISDDQMEIPFFLANSGDHVLTVYSHKRRKFTYKIKINVIALCAVLFFSIGIFASTGILCAMFQINRAPCFVLTRLIACNPVYQIPSVLFGIIKL